MSSRHSCRQIFPLEALVLEMKPFMVFRILLKGSSGSSNWPYVDLIFVEMKMCFWRGKGFNWFLLSVWAVRASWCLPVWNQKTSLIINGSSEEKEATVWTSHINLFQILKDYFNVLSEASLGKMCGLAAGNRRKRKLSCFHHVITAIE